MRAAGQPANNEASAQTAATRQNHTITTLLVIGARSSAPPAAVVPGADDHGDVADQRDTSERQHEPGEEVAADEHAPIMAAASTMAPLDS